MQTIGQILKAAREEKELTLEKVFQATRIRVNHLQSLEDDDLSSMPSLTELDIQENQIEYFPWGLLDKPDMRILVVKNNPFIVTLHTKIQNDFQNHLVLDMFYKLFL